MVEKEKTCQEEEKSCLEDFKKEYSKLKEQHSLPEFDKLNKDFQIERSADAETDYLIREIRKTVSDKIANYLRFFEAFMNPSAAPLFIHHIIKNLGQEEMSIIKETYKKLSKREIDLIGLDLEFNEDKEAKFINETVIEWDGIKEDLKKVLEHIDKMWNSETGKNNNGYFS